MTETVAVYEASDNEATISWAELLDGSGTITSVHLGRNGFLIPCRIHFEAGQPVPIRAIYERVASSPFFLDCDWEELG